MQQLQLEGQRFNRLLVYMKSTCTAGKRTWWRCKCDCGNIVEVRGTRLTAGSTQSCGCLQKEIVAEIHKKETRYSSIPGYRSWSGMLQRCLNPEHEHYKYYGGRGITVCPEWREFENFLKDMGERPVGHSLDRIDVNGNYEPTNCKWSTYREQVRNRRPFTVNSDI